MKTKNDQQWAQQQAELRSDGEVGRRFLTFFTFWFDAADRMLSEVEPGPLGGFRRHSVAEAMRTSLELAEKELGFVPFEWVGQMLVVATMHWLYGEDLVAEMTYIERRLMEQELAKKIQALKYSAQNLQNPVSVATEENPQQEGP